MKSQQLDFCNIFLRHHYTISLTRSIHYQCVPSIQIKGSLLQFQLYRDQLKIQIFLFFFQVLDCLIYLIIPYGFYLRYRITIAIITMIIAINRHTHQSGSSTSVSSAVGVPTVSGPADSPIFIFSSPAANATVTYLAS